jgi:hypothetical protein
VADLFLPALALDDPLVELLEEVVNRQVADCRAAQGLEVRHHLDESKPPAEGGIHVPQTPVDGVHRPQDVDVRRNRERLLALGQRDGHPALVGLQQCDQLTEDLAQVGPIDLVDEYQIGALGMRLGRPADPLQDPVGQLQVDRATVGIGRFEPLDEILVGIRRVEGHRRQGTDRLVGRRGPAHSVAMGRRLALRQSRLQLLERLDPGERTSQRTRFLSDLAGQPPEGEPARRVGLAGPRRSVQDDLLFRLQCLGDAFERWVVGEDDLFITVSAAPKDAAVQVVRDLRDGHHAPPLLGRDFLCIARVPVDGDGVFVRLPVVEPDVTGVDDTADGQYLGFTPVGDDDVAGLQLPEHPEFVGFFGQGRAVVFVGFPEGGLECLFERPLRLEFPQVTDLVPADPDVAVLPTVVPVFGVSSGSDFDDPTRFVGMRPVVQETLQLLWRPVGEGRVATQLVEE